MAANVSGVPHLCRRLDCAKVAIPGKGRGGSSAPLARLLVAHRFATSSATSAPLLTYNWNWPPTIGKIETSDHVP